MSGRTRPARACAATATAVVVVQLLALNARAHRLDEYLQAARLSIASSRVDVELDLTPGVSIAPRIVAAIDTNSDGQLDDEEAGIYASRVLRDLSLDVDGRRQPATLVSVKPPTLDALREGAGTIRLLVRAEIGGTAAGRHVLRFANHHEPQMGAYLANAMTPTDRSIAIGRQTRDPRQQELQIEYTIAGNGHLPWLVLGSLGVAGALAWRRVRTASRRVGARQP